MDLTSILKAVVMVDHVVEIEADMPFEEFLSVIAMILEERCKTEEGMTVEKACEILKDSAKSVHETLGEYESIYD